MRVEITATRFLGLNSVDDKCKLTFTPSKDTDSIFLDISGMRSNFLIHADEFDSLIEAFGYRKEAHHG